MRSWVQIQYHKKVYTKEPGYSSWQSTCLACSLGFDPQHHKKIKIRKKVKNLFRNYLNLQNQNHKYLWLWWKACYLVHCWCWIHICQVDEKLRFYKIKWPVVFRPLKLQYKRSLQRMHTAWSSGITGQLLSFHWAENHCGVLSRLSAQRAALCSGAALSEWARTFMGLTT
jgi:hypothetical protein